MENNNADPNLTEGEPNTSEQSTRTINNQTQRQNGWKEVSTKSRFYRTEKQILLKSTQKCGGNKHPITSI